MKKFFMAVSVYHITFVAAELLFLCTVLSSAQTTYYVKPDNGTPCPTESDPYLTLSQYAQDFNQYFGSEVDIVLEFLPGEHGLTTDIVFVNFSRVALKQYEVEFGSESKVICGLPAEVRFVNITSVLITNLAFVACGQMSAVFVDNIHLTNFFVKDSVETALFLNGSNAVVENATFTNNTADHGAVNVFYSNATFVHSYFANNFYGGGFVAYSSNVWFTGENIFKNNYGDVGGAVRTVDSQITFTGTTQFITNIAFFLGGGICIEFSTLNVDGSIGFENNFGQSGGGIFVYHGTVKMVGSSTFKSNHATIFEGGGITLYFASLTISGDCLMQQNSAVAGGAIAMFVSSAVFSGRSRFIHNSGTYEGGAIQMMENSTVVFNGSSTLTNNSADNGAGIYAETSNVSFSGNSNFLGNKANQSGGGMHAKSTDVMFFHSYTSHTSYLANGNKSFGTVSFTSNSASKGGAVSLELNSILHLGHKSELLFQNNSANRGGAISVSDIISINDCSVKPNSTDQLLDQFAQHQALDLTTNDQQHDNTDTNPCFFQFESSTIQNTVLTFVNNSATTAGTVLYGGKLDRCKFSTGFLHVGSPLETFKNISTITTNDHVTSNISSDPVGICFNFSNERVCDSQRPVHVSVIRGQTFALSAVAVGQGYGSVPTVIRSEFSKGNADLGDDQHIQQTGKEFLELHYSVFSAQDFEELVLYPEGPCRDTGIAKRLVYVNLLPCPDGFEYSYSKCICDKRLQQFTNSCDVDSGTIERDGNFWMSSFYTNGSYVGLILHPHCPFDYCIARPIPVRPDNPNTQCAFHRADILCGACQENFSLALGSSHCLQCSNAYLSLLIPFALAGIILVVLILVLRLTVSVGTINGLIFYANVLAINRIHFFPPGEINILTVFIAWLNLDLGIETCFYDGMDAYARTWLQFAFPIYVWSLVGIIMVVSNRSARLSRLLGTNPVSVLATLFLLSYAKILRAILASLRYTNLDYPDGSHVSVLLYDGNIPYFSDKHIPLCLVVLLLALLFLAYTLLLLLGQWLQALSNRKLFSWISKPKVKAFLDAYYGPYEDKHCYWTGMLLLIRFALSLVFVFNVLQDPSTNLLSIASVSLSLSVMTRFTGQIYKKLWLDALEASFILNLGILAAATYHVKLTGGNQAALIYTSVSIAFVTFIGIIVYHIYLQTHNNKSCQRLNVLQITHHMIDKYRRRNENEAQSPGPEANKEVTSSVVYMELREPMLEDS